MSDELPAGFLPGFEVLGLHAVGMFMAVWRGGRIWQIEFTLGCPGCTRVRRVVGWPRRRRSTPRGQVQSSPLSVLDAGLRRSAMRQQYQAAVVRYGR